MRKKGLQDIMVLHNIQGRFNIVPILIEKIMTSVDITYAQQSILEELGHYFESKYIENEGILHDFYKFQFNGVDLFNRLFNRVNEKHQNNEWRSKFTLNMLRVGVINLFIYDIFDKNISFFKWRESLEDMMISRLKK